MGKQQTCKRITPTSISKLSKRISIYFTSRGIYRHHACVPKRGTMACGHKIVHFAEASAKQVRKVFHTEAKRLKETESVLKSIPFNFGVNKKQQLVRLIYELSKIKNVTPAIILKEAFKGNSLEDAKQAFIYLKDCFLRQRFPRSYKNNDKSSFYLPKLSIEDKYFVSSRYPRVFYPREIIVEEDTRGYALTKSITQKFPLARMRTVAKLKDHLKAHSSGSGIDDYNKRVKRLFLIRERYDFIKPCPCSKGVVGCGYYILNLGFGCRYECSYCFLQNYANISGIIIPVNIEDFLGALGKFLKNTKGDIRIGTGEFTDSLALDNLTGFSQTLIEFFSKVNNATLELKTKSNNINGILNLKHNRRTVISWSLNPQSLIDSDEWYANSLKERLEAARKCCQAGYLVGFHFDPIVYSKNWEVLYKGLVDSLFGQIEPQSIAWISLGTFRFAPRLKTIIEQRFPRSEILNEELVIDFDNKLRYPRKQRVMIYKKLYSWIRQYSGSVLVYLCMEPKDVWREALSRERL